MCKPGCHSVPAEKSDGLKKTGRFSGVAGTLRQKSILGYIRVYILILFSARRLERCVHWGAITNRPALFLIMMLAFKRKATVTKQASHRHTSATASEPHNTTGSL